MKKQPSNLSRLMQYAGSHRYLTYASWILSAGSALLALVPFWYLWKIIAEVIDVMPDFSKAELEKAIETYNHRDRRYGGVKEEEEQNV